MSNLKVMEFSQTSFAFQKAFLFSLGKKKWKERKREKILWGIKWLSETNNASVLYSIDCDVAVSYMELQAPCSLFR